MLAGVVVDITEEGFEGVVNCVVQIVEKTTTTT